MREKTVYLDYNATTPVDPEVAAVMLPYFAFHFGNPSSAHEYGIRARTAVEEARRRVAAFLNCTPGEVIFTGGGTESNNLAIMGCALARHSEGNHIITSAVEHPAVAEVCRALEGRGFRVSFIPVDTYGMVDLDLLTRAITKETILISVMHANNEVGTIEPIEEIAALARARNITFHTDAAQSAGKIPVDVSALGVDLLSIAGHKMYAPKGVGALFIRQGTSLIKIMHGAGHEKNLRPGTENVPGIVGLGKACEIAQRDMDYNFYRMHFTRDRMREKLQSVLDNIRIHSDTEACTPNTLSVGFRNINASELILELTDVAVSAGSACHADMATISHVLTAMNIPVEYARGTIRISTGKMTTEEEIDTAADILIDKVRKLRSRP